MTYLGGAFECDVCKTLRKPDTTGWYMASPDLPLVIFKWDDKFAFLGTTYTHLCGVECTQKWVGQQLTKVQP